MAVFSSVSSVGHSALARIGYKRLAALVEADLGVGRDARGELLELLAASCPTR